MGRLRHLDFELKIERQGERYLAKALRSPAGEASGTFELPFSEDRLEILVLRLGRLRASTRRIHLDYCFGSNDFADGLHWFEVGKHETWHQWSDHTPIICSFI